MADTTKGEETTQGQETTQEEKTSYFYDIHLGETHPRICENNENPFLGCDYRPSFKFQDTFKSFKFYLMDFLSENGYSLISLNSFNVFHGQTQRQNGRFLFPNDGFIRVETNKPVANGIWGQIY